MAEGTKILQRRKAGPFADGTLAAGQLGLDVTNGKWFFSRDGVTSETFADGVGAVTLTDLTDVQIASLASGNVLYYNGTNWLNATAVNAGLVSVLQKGAVDGVATLDSSGKIPSSQIPALALAEVYVVSNITERDALAVQAGDTAIVLSASPETYIFDGSAWQEIKITDTAIDAQYIVAGNIAAARMAGNVIAAINSASAGTINNPNLTIDGGTV